LKSVSGTGQVDLVGYFAAALCLLNLVMAFVLLPESLKEKQHHIRFNFKVISGIVTELKKPSIRELLLINFIFITAFMIMQMSSTLFWKEFIGLNEIQMGNMFAFIGLATVIVQGGLVGKMVKKFGEIKLLTYGSYLCIASLLMIPWVTKATFVPFELIAFALLALANGCITPSITSLLSKAADPKDVGQVLGVNQSFGSLARAVGMGVSGFIYGLEFHLPFMVGAFIMIVSVWLAANLQRDLKKVAGITRPGS
jgi:DHA1 family tetracycline resistance protein-like MFS transporter